MLKKTAIITTIIIILISIFSITGYALEDVKKYYYQGQYDNAINRLEEILDNIEDNDRSQINEEISEYEIYRNLAIIYLDKGDQESALSNFRKAEFSKAGFKAILENAIALYNAGWYNDAEEKFKKIFAEYNNDLNGNKNYVSHLYYFAGLNSIKLGEYNKAIERFQKGISFDSGYIQYYIGIGEIAESTGDIVQAARNYGEAFSRDTSLTYLLPIIARGYEERGDYYQAFQFWQRSIRVGVEEDYARQRTDMLRDKYPELRPDPDREVPEPTWRDVKPINVKDSTPEIDVGLINNVSNLRFQVDS
ncbi:MAG: tetratricopeptide repeat protein, partial [Bacillota bacterium]